MEWSPRIELHSAPSLQVSVEATTFSRQARTTSGAVQAELEYQPAGYPRWGSSPIPVPVFPPVAVVDVARVPGAAAVASARTVLRVEGSPYWTADHRYGRARCRLRAEFELGVAGLAAGEYPLFGSLQRPGAGAGDPPGAVLPPGVVRCGALRILPSPGSSAIDIPLAQTVFGPILADPKRKVAKTADGDIPFTAERTGFPVLQFRAVPPAEKIPVRQIAAALLPLVRIIEAYVDRTPVETQIFTFFYTLARKDAEPDFGAVDARARETSNNMVGLCRGAAERALRAADHTQMERRLREPLNTAHAAISADPDNFSAYLWAARLHLLLDEPHAALDFFLTLVFRLRLFERPFREGQARDRELRDLRRAHAAARGRLDRAFWKEFRETAGALELDRDWPLAFPKVSAAYPG